jgi:curli biogenesis system outer membrane secretion channel CsgG
MIMRIVLIAVMAALTLVQAGEALSQQPSAPAMAGLRKTVAVESFGGTEVFGGQVSGDGLSALLSDVLLADGRFVVVERGALAGIQTEQQLSETGGSRMIGAGYLIRGTVTSYNPAAGGGGLRIGGSPGGSRYGLGGGVQGRKIVLKVSLRLIDATTGQVVATATAEGTATSQSTDVGILDNKSGATMGLNALKDTALGKAAEDAIRKAVGKIVLDSQKAPWKGLVVDVRGESVILNAGTDQNVTAGMVFGVYRSGEALTDPGTGEVLDVEVQRLGSVRVESVREKVSVARMVEGESPSRGDLLKPE